MDFDQPIDEAQALSYNNGNEADEGTVIRVDRRNLKAINDPNCAHEYTLDLEDGDAEMFDVYKCKLCPVGFLADKTK